jgi:NitT/TauT family transport system permease protein
MPSDRASTPGWRTRAGSLVAGCVVWELAARLIGSPFFPSFTATMSALAELLKSEVFLGNIAVSLTNLAVGFALACAVGVGMGIATARIRLVELIVEPYLHALLAAPGIIYVPLLFTLFGATRPTQIGSVFLHAVFVVVATTAGALKPENTTLMAMASSFGARQSQVFWKIRWPLAVPLVVSGLRVGALLAVKGMINGEMFIAYTGLGAMIRTYGARFEVAKLLAIVVVIAAVAVACSVGVDRLARRVRRSAA